MNFYGFSLVLVAFICTISYVSSLEIEAIDCKALGKKVGVKNLHTDHLYFPHEEECNLFYHCGSAGAALKECGGGTIFSLKHKDCRRPENTKCFLLETWFEKKNITLPDFYNEDY